MELDTSGWSGDGTLTQRLIAAMETLPEVLFLKVEDAPTTRSDAGFSFISNELLVGFASTRRVRRTVLFGVVPWWTSSAVPNLTLAELETHLAAIEEIGPADYSDSGMLQFLRAERVIPAYQTRGYKLIEMVRVYGSSAPPRAGPKYGGY